jgi:hypothetical protein
MKDIDLNELCAIVYDKSRMAFICITDTGILRRLMETHSPPRSVS